MKITILGILLMLGVAVSTVWANANFSVDDKVNKMKTELKLTDQQADAVRPILEDYKAKMEQINVDKEQKLSNVLSVDQMSQYRTLKDKYHQDLKSLSDSQAAY